MDRQNTTTEPHWESFFGFDEPYENQRNAIESAIQAGTENGYLVMEGPCGTGKTMAALTAAAYLVRATDSYDNVLVVTPVKQQLEQFVDDLRMINESLASPLTGVGLVGKPDLCPYEREDSFPDDVSVHTRCEDLRETTADLVTAQKDASMALDPGAAPTVNIRRKRDDAETWWDSQRALELVHDARIDGHLTGSPGTALGTAGESSPYPAAQPTAPDELGGTPTETTGLYCPFEADWYARDQGSPVGFDHGKNNVVTIEDYLPEAVGHGTCPHRVMTVLLESAEIVIGNYNHLFDPQTRSLTERILTDRTFVIVDEAHRLEERVRSLLSTTIGRQTLRRARQDSELLRRLASRDRQHQDQINASLAEFDVRFDDVTAVNRFYTDLLDWFHSRIDTAFENHDASSGSEKDRIEIPLRDPTANERDELTDWAITQGYDAEFWESLSSVGLAVEQTLEIIEPERSCMITTVGAHLQSWFESNNTSYFREIELEPSPTPTRQLTESWEDQYTPRLVMYNCLPSHALANVLDTLGGGIIMSATLEPLDIFTHVSGLDELAAPPEARPVIKRSYDLPFPRENRATWAVDATPFTARNRGSPAGSSQTDTREEYTQILVDIARSPGNVMLCLPSYAEAAWAATQLRTQVDKPVLVDESSSAHDTTKLKREFFDSDGAVLVTSTRGTLTEGIDYDGDKLRTCAVIGVPLVNIGSPRVRAVKHAYGNTFGEQHAFEYALTIPAVRRARQAIGRVIRGPAETGVRILVDNRYTERSTYGSVHQYFPRASQEEFVRMAPMFLQHKITEFWGATEA